MKINYMKALNSLSTKIVTISRSANEGRILTAFLSQVFDQNI
jgi:hypothetical protein